MVDRFKDMNKFLEEHGIKPVIAKVFAFEDAKDAYRYVREETHMGKVVIRIFDD
jgi:NADPH:quinone reductase-like Zn-dependent oxidoreductase